MFKLFENMFKLFENADDELHYIGFVKIRDDEYGCEYARQFSTVTQKVVIIRKKSGRHIMQYYNKILFDNGNTCVGLTSYEMSLFLRKMKQI